MSDRISIRVNRISALIMSVTMLGLMLLSFFFIAAEAGHECEGEDCHICECIKQCCNTVRRIGEGAVRVIAVALAAGFTVLILPCAERRFSEETLVSKKIRMND